ncbi:MAG: hypothetical protein Q8Q81_01565 [Oxalobacteraceae bacterium]|nr:hypothetical protein [Oxalobacteraceae bacterium]
MTLPDSAALANLANLARIGKLKAEPPDARERAGLLRSAAVRLQDARQTTLALESRFDLAYNAAHAAALSALRAHGYRSENRYLVFQCLEHTLGFTPQQWLLLNQAHTKRHLAEGRARCHGRLRRRADRTCGVPDCGSAGAGDSVVTESAGPRTALAPPWNCLLD